MFGSNLKTCDLPALKYLFSLQCYSRGNIIGSPKIRNKFWRPNILLIELFTIAITLIAPIRVIALPTQRQQKISLLFSLLNFWMVGVHGSRILLCIAMVQLSIFLELKTKAIDIISIAFKGDKKFFQLLLSQQLKTITLKKENEEMKQYVLIYCIYNKNKQRRLRVTLQENEQ